MRRTTAVLIAGLALASVGMSVEARDTKLILSIKDALDKGKAEGIIDDSVKLRFGKGNTIGRVIGSDVANRKTNAVNKTDVEACNWVFLTAVRDLQSAAKKSGADALVGIVSYFKKNEFSSATEFECHAGAIMAGVALKASYAKTK
jgi:uncharacterized protein YbjQ (UPF0145 family)